MPKKYRLGNKEYHYFMLLVQFLVCGIVAVLGLNAVFDADTPIVIRYGAFLLIGVSITGFFSMECIRQELIEEDTEKGDEETL